MNVNFINVHHLTATRHQKVTEKRKSELFLRTDFFDLKLEEWLRKHSASILSEL